MGYRDFIPASDAGLLSFASNLSTRVSATPTAFGVLVADATFLASLVADYTTRLNTATNPATRTRVAVTNKNVSRAALKADIRKLARIMQAYPQMTDGFRQELGLTVRDREPTPIPAPCTRPVVSAYALGGRQIGLSLADELTTTSHRKPPGVRSAHLWVKVAEPGAPAPASREECQFMGAATRCNHVLNHPGSAANKVAWIIAQWANEREEVGPESPAISCTIAA